MITHNARYEELATAPVKTTDVIVTRRILGDTGYIDDTFKWASSDILMSVRIDAVGEMLGSATKKAVVKLLGIVDGTKAGDVFQIRLGIKDTTTSVFNYLSQGHFIVDNVDCDYEGGSTTVTMYDHMWKAGKTLYSEAVATNAVTYPISVKDFATFVASLIDVKLMPDFDDLPNSQYMILEDLYSEISGATLQNVIQDIAGATGTTARITETNLTFSRFDYKPVPFDDDFDSIDTTKWTTYNAAQITSVGGQLNIALPSGSTQYHGLSSPLFDMTNKSISSKLVSAGNQSLIGVEAYPVQVHDASNANGVSWMVSGGQKYAYKTVSSTRTAVYSSAYSTTDDIYFRIRETAGKTYWETSVDGYVWTTKYSATTPVNMTAFSVELTAGTWRAESSSSSVIIDKFNILPIYGKYMAQNLNSNSLKTLKIADTYGPVTSVVLGRQPQNDNIALYAAAPANSTVTAVNTTTNLLTIAAHAMANGNMVRFASTGTLPAPLVANKSYYVYTNGATDTFALAPTYSNAVAGTKLIDLTTAGTGTISIVTLPTREIQINNNEILDDDRQTLLPPLYNSLSAIDWTDVKADTVGIGCYEVGDVIQFTQGTRTVRAFLNEIHLTLAGSIKENLISIAPKVAAIDYQAAGGIIRTLYNTEIKVDKQAQQITSVVDQQTAFEGQMLEDFTQVYQDIDDITLTVQKAGGGNLILNSVGYATDKQKDASNVDYEKLASWTYPTSYSLTGHGTVTSSDSSESQSYGGVSGRLIKLSSDYVTGKTVSITQRVNVAVNTSLSFGVRVRNPLGQGGGTITLYNDNDSFTITIPSTTNYVWEEFSIVDFKTSMPWINVKVQASAANFQFTDLRLLYGSTLQGWVQSNAEILSTLVQFTTDGMRIFDESHDTETRVTYNEFSTRRKADNVVLFEADDVGVSTNDLTVRGTTKYVNGSTTVIKQITIPSSSALAGIAFIKG